jgi:hypothetical protein
MFRTFVRQALAVAMIAGASYACQAVRAQDDYCADCPGGHAHGIGLHGHGHHGYGHRPYGDYPLAYNRAAYDENMHEYAGAGGVHTCPGGNCQYRYYGQPDLFYNYYTWNNCGAIPAALYVSPRPVPPHVGHTYITYQPLYPHEFMYTHHRTYHRYYNGGQGLNRTSVHYRYSPFGESHFWH